MVALHGTQHNINSSSKMDQQQTPCRSLSLHSLQRGERNDHAHVSCLQTKHEGPKYRY